MQLRKCPSCHDTVGAKSPICPRCGVSFKAAAIRRGIIWIMTAGLIGWAVMHFWVKGI